MQSILDWIKANATAVQAVLTLFGSAVAVGIALYSQHATSRREQNFRALQARAVGAAIGWELLNLACIRAAQRLILGRSVADLAHLTDPEILERSMMKIPEGFTQILSQAHLLGPTITGLATRVIAGAAFYNATTTVEERLKASEDFGERLSALDKELGNHNPTDFRH